MKVFKKALAATAVVLIGLANICSIDVQPLIGNIDTVNAETYSDSMQYGDLYYKQVDEDEDGTYDYIEITDCDESVKTAEIPSEFDGFPVTSIGHRAFYNCTSLRSIEIPDSVTTIGEDAFENCKSLTSIEVSENNSSYSSIDGVLFNKNKTELICFPIGSEITEYIIPDSVTLIGNYAFSVCSGLTSIKIPNGVTSIGVCAFYYCTSLTSIEIPNSVTSIGNSAFSDCSSLTSIDVSENNSSYSSNDGVLFNKNKTELICFPIGSEITEYIIPDSVTLIGNYAFSFCSGLTSIKIPNGVTSIGVWAFMGCSGLTSIEIPDSVTSIGKSAFIGCSGLTSITIENPECEIYDYEGTISNGNSFGINVFYNGVIRGYENSTAQAYAEKYNYKFESLDEKPTEPTESTEPTEPPTTTEPTTTSPATTKLTTTNQTTTKPATTSSVTTEPSVTTKPAVTTEPAVTTKPTETEPVSGDIDGDGKATLYDAIIVCKCIINAKDVTEEQKKNADVNGDGHIDLYDAIYVAECMIGKHK